MDASTTLLKSNFTLSKNFSGFWVLEDPDSKERMHPLGNPLKESEVFYCSPCRIEERLKKPSNSPLIVWDVGLGMGANASACLSIAFKLQENQKRDLKIFSFEKFPDGFRQAVGDSERFPHLDYVAADTFAKQGFFTDSKVEWRLIEGDFFENWKQVPAPEVIFYDPFSQRVNPDFWNLNTFTKLLEICSEVPTVLATYAVARNIREALKASGWNIAKGPGFQNRKKSLLATNALEKNSHYSYDWWN